MQLNQAAPGLSIYEPSPSVGQNIGAAFSGGISSGLEMLMQSKMQGMQQEKMANAYQALGMPAELATLDPAIQKEILSQYGQESQQAKLLKILGGGEGTPAVPSGMPSGGAPAAPLPQGGEEVVGEEISVGGPQEQKRGLAQLTDQEEAAVGVLNPALGRQVSAAKARETKEQSERWKFNKEFIQEVSKRENTGIEQLGVLREMTSLIDSKELISPLYASILKRLGLDYAVLKNPASEAFEKFSTGFIKGLKDVFGGRISVQEMITFLKTIPSLENSDTGKRLVARALQSAADGAVLRGQETDKIIAEYEKRGQAPPYNLQRIVEQRLRPKLDALAEQLHQDLEGIRVEAARIKKEKPGFFSRGKKRKAPPGGFSEGRVSMRLPNGTIVGVKEGDVAALEAKKATRL
jgi:hypothetical protein